MNIRKTAATTLKFGTVATLGTFIALFIKSFEVMAWEHPDFVLQSLSKLPEVAGFAALLLAIAYFTKKPKRAR